jgi:hypothetical protein
MKTLKLSFVLFLLAGIMGCTKNNSQPLSNSSDPADQAAILVAGSVSASSNGTVNVADGLVIDAQAKVALDTLCGTSWTDSASTTSPIGAQTTYSYKSVYVYTINCGTSNNFSGSATSNLTYSGSFDGPNLSSTNSGTSDFTVTGLGKGSSSYTLNGEYKRSGSFQSKTDNTYYGTNDIDIVVTNLVLTKPGRKVQSGSATVTVSANTAKKGNFNYTGTIVFNSDNTATLTINGNIYIIENATGIVNKRN